MCVAGARGRLVVRPGRDPLRSWRLPRVTTVRQWREVVWRQDDLGVRRPSVPEVFVSHPAAQSCTRCGGHVWIHRDGTDDRCIACDPREGDPQP
jgi:hypothetical protein